MRVHGMSKIILMVLLAIASGSAAADWAVFSRNNDFTGYIDSTSIIRTNNLVRVSSLIDFRAVRTDAGKTFVSVKAQHEFNCAEGQVRKLFLSELSGSMGKGEIVNYSYKIGNFELIQPSSILEALWRVVCE
jgi:hypothetical protein